MKEAEDTSVNGMIDEGFVQLNNGKVNNFKFGTNNGVELTAEDIKGAIVNCVVEEGDISMLDRIDMPENPNVGDCVFNEKLNRPIWFNGKNWVDANGLIVG